MRQRAHVHGDLVIAADHAANAAQIPVGIKYGLGIRILVVKGLCIVFRPVHKYTLSRQVRQGGRIGPDPLLGDTLPEGSAALQLDHGKNHILSACADTERLETLRTFACHHRCDILSGLCLFQA